MKCPRDGTVMTFIDDGAHMRNRCPGCSGLLLDKEEVAAALGRKPDPARVAALPQSKVACPRDGKPMRALEHNGVELDMCAACGALWFDAGELEKVTERKSRAGRNVAVAAAVVGGVAVAGVAVAAAASPAQASVADGAVSGIGDVVAGGAIEVVFELVGEVLGALF